MIVRKIAWFATVTTVVFVYKDTFLQILEFVLHVHLNAQFVLLKITVLNVQ
jgi:hypothetical protein